MTLLRASTVVTGLVGGVAARSKLNAANAIVISAAPWWSKKGAVIKNAPYTINNPTKGQLQVRMAFGDIAKAKSGVPNAAYKGAAGFIARTTAQGGMQGYRAPGAMAKGSYPSKAQHTFHTLAQLHAQAQRLGLETPAIPSK
jgi:hypothetical protein